MDTYTRIGVYTQASPGLTHRQRRRVVKKAGRDPQALVVRDSGMGFSPAFQGFRELAGFERRPVE